MYSYSARSPQRGYVENAYAHFFVHDRYNIQYLPAGGSRHARRNLTGSQERERKADVGAFQADQGWLGEGCARVRRWQRRVQFPKQQGGIITIITTKGKADGMALNLGASAVSIKLVKQQTRIKFDNQQTQGENHA